MLLNKKLKKAIFLFASSWQVICPADRDVRPQRLPVSCSEYRFGGVPQRAIRCSAYSFVAPTLPAIFSAAQDNDLETLKRLVCVPFLANVRANDGDRHTALHVAAFYGNKEAVEFLLSKGANPRLTSDGSLFPLHMACFYRYAIDADLQTAEDLGGEPPHVITEPRHLCVLNMLLEAAPELVNTTSDNDRWTPLHFIAGFGTQPMAELLVMYGASLSARNSDGQTPEDLYNISTCQDGRIDFKRLKTFAASCGKVSHGSE